MKVKPSQTSVAERGAKMIVEPQECKEEMLGISRMREVLFGVGISKIQSMILWSDQVKNGSW